LYGGEDGANSVQLSVLQPDGLVSPAVTNVRASTLKKENKKKKDSAGFANPMYFDTKVNMSTNNFQASYPYY